MSDDEKSGQPPAAKKRGKPSKTWVATFNNYTDEQIETIRSWGDDMTRIVVAKEVGEEGTPHLQCFMTFRVAKRMSAVQKMMKGYWATAKCKDAALYCKKQGSEVVIDIDNRAPGARNDLVEIKKKIEDGATIKQLWEDHYGTMVRCYRGVYESIGRLRPPVERADYTDFKLEKVPLTKPHILWGEPGIGKTQFALSHFQNPLCVTHMDGLKELDPATHDGVVFDDMEFCHLPRSTQLHLVSIEKRVHIHARNTNGILPKGFPRLFTTNKYGGRIIDLDDGAISRRVTVTEVTSGNIY